MANWFPTCFFFSFGGSGPRHPAAVVSVFESLSSRLSYGKLAMPITIWWTSLWVEKSWSPELKVYLFPHQFIFLLKPCLLLTIQMSLFSPLITSSGLFVRCSVTRHETRSRRSANSFSSNRASNCHIYKQDGALFVENLSWHAAGVVDATCKKRRGGWTTERSKI